MAILNLSSAASVMCPPQRWAAVGLGDRSSYGVAPLTFPRFPGFTGGEAYIGLTEGVSISAAPASPQST